MFLAVHVNLGVHKYCWPWIHIERLKIHRNTMVPVNEIFFVELCCGIHQFVYIFFNLLVHFYWKIFRKYLSLENIQLPISTIRACLLIQIRFKKLVSCLSVNRMMQFRLLEFRVTGIFVQTLYPKICVDKQLKCTDNLDLKFIPECT